MIEIYTDGACRNNQNSSNIGAWAYWMHCFEENIEKEDYAIEFNTTNNKMELTAVIKALQALKEPAKKHKILVYSDSQYVVSGVSNWSTSWIAKGWKNVKNSNLWQQLLALISQYSNIEFIKVSGHSNNTKNDYVDLLCNKAMDQKEV